MRFFQYTCTNYEGKNINNYLSTCQVRGGEVRDKHLSLQQSTCCNNGQLHHNIVRLLEIISLRLKTYKSPRIMLTF